MTRTTLLHDENVFLYLNTGLKLVIEYFYINVLLILLKETSASTLRFIIFAKCFYTAAYNLRRVSNQHTANYFSIVVPSSRKKRNKQLQLNLQSETNV